MTNSKQDNIQRTDIKNMNIIMFVSNTFTNDPRVYNEATSLINAGHEVTVIAWNRDGQNVPEETWDGINVIRLKTKIRTNHTKLNWLWVGLGLVLWQRKAFKYAVIVHDKIHFDGIHCHDFDTLFIGLRLKNKFKIPLIYDAHEIYAYMLARTFPQWVVKSLIFMEKMAVKKVDRIINVCEPQRDYFQSITEKSITLIMNSKPLENKEYQKPPNNDLFTILYIGALHQGRLVPLLINTAKDIPGVQCLIGGIGQEQYIRYIKEECMKTSNCVFIGEVPYHEVIPMTRKANCIYLMLSPFDLNNRLALANKQFEAMVCGRPILCTKGTYAGEITEQEHIGLTIENLEDSLRKAIIQLRDDNILCERLGKNALKAAIREYNWQKQEERLLSLYDTLI